VTHLDRGISYWRSELLRAAKEVLKDSVLYTLKLLVGSFVEEYLVRRPLKKIMEINRKWDFDDEEDFMYDYQAA
jgi:hypothetical protein